MKYLLHQGPPAELQADWLIAGVWENEPLPGPLQALDGRLDGTLTRLRERGDLSGKYRELTPLLDCTGIAATRLLMVGMGPRSRADIGVLQGAAATAARSITTRETIRIAMLVPEGSNGVEETLAAIGVGLRCGSEGPGLRKGKPERFAPREVVLAVPAEADGSAVQAGLRRAEVEGKAVGLARELVNLPPCDLYPETFADRARQTASQAGVECLVFDEKQLAAEHMQVIMAVARGSEKPPRLVLLRYRGNGDGPLLGLVGKGVTFDSGGLSLKTTDQMVDMKCDMAGAAAVLASVCAMAELKLPVNVLGLCPLVENLPGSRAMKLGDVIRARNGKTIEVLNTDAEGRLILADALSYAVDQKVARLVDLATLTGACMIALGSEVAGLMSNDENWSVAVREAAARAGEKVWPLPMFPLYRDMIKSDVADMKNTGGSRYAGAISAAKFLEEFVDDVPWVHLDIAGPAWAEKENASRDAGGTGCMVRTLIELGRRPIG